MILDKAKMAHEMALELIKLVPDLMAYQLAERCFEYADAMQVEADKRVEKGVPDAIRDSRNLNKGENGNCLHFHHEFGHRKCMDCGASLKAWQPDWSQAPAPSHMFDDERVNYWCQDQNGDAWWFSLKPKAAHGQWNSKNELGFAIKAPSFDYKGDWRDSLRKRPEVE